jgi:hypothetical protein
MSYEMDAAVNELTIQVGKKWARVTV